MIYAQPGQTFEAVLEGAGTGLEGELGVQVVDPPAGDVLLPRTTDGITEVPAGSGIYAVGGLTAPSSTGRFLVVWDTGGLDPTFSSEELVVTWTPPAPEAAPGPSYTTPDAVRAEAGVTVDLLDDATANRLIADAEDLVDSLLGARYMHDNGRKVLVGNVPALSWTKLGRATAKLAARMHTDPQLFGQESRWTSISGPDFSVSGPRGAGPLQDVLLLLNASGLRRLGARMV